ncbi:MAG TPA: hypothetical protein VGM37_02965 [Armatimonadota bacterium]|jgi:hypothetical protein
MTDRPLTPEERDQALEAIAERIHRFRLETPAIFFLEMNRPLAGIAGLAVHAVTPLFGAFTGLDTAERYAALVGEPEALDGLVDRLDRYRETGESNARSEKRRGAQTK